MSSNERLTDSKTVREALVFLSSQQQSDGGFLSLSSPDPHSFSQAITFHSIFSTAVILSSLHNIPKTEALQKKAAMFLLSQKSAYWSLNYWKRGSTTAKAMPYPDDLDDTFCALSALYLWKPKRITGSVMAKIVSILTTNEVQVGGPYRTWLVPETAEAIWKDIDLVVNANVAYFLSLHDVELPNVTQFIEKAIVTNTLESPYYPSIFPILYFISRVYKGSLTKNLIELLLSRRNKKGYWDDAITTALSCSTLLNFNFSSTDLTRAIQYLVKTQKNGSWPPGTFYTGVNPKRDKPYYAGSESLTTAFCIEAIYKYQEHSSKISRINPKEETKAHHIQKKILEVVNKRFQEFPDEVKTQADKMLSSVLTTDEKNQVTLLPYLFGQSLGSLAKKIPDDLYVTLGTANLYGWLAYTIYDNFWDEEGDIQTLSIANIALRELTLIFSFLFPKESEFNKIFTHTIDAIEASNQWEVTHCRIKTKEKSIHLRSIRLPSFGKLDVLYQKSFGHALGPIAILYYLGYSMDSKEMKHLFVFLQQYLIARQLNDDAHDWQKDFAMGNITSVVRDLLESYRTHSKSSQFQFKKDLPKLQELFWDTTILDVCSTIRSTVVRAQKHLRKLSIIEEPETFESLLSIIEKATDEAISERKKTLEFLKSYKE